MPREGTAHKRVSTQPSQTTHPTLVAGAGIESGLSSRLRLVALDGAGYMAPWEVALYPW